MQFQRLSDSKSILVESGAALGAGGEARIFAVLPGRELVAKIYHHPETVQANKLHAMLVNPPDDPMAETGHISIAWPLDLLQNADPPRFVGYLMPRVSGMRPIFTYYNPAVRRRLSPLFHTLYLHRAARNLAAAVRALHSRGYVIGDVNESNILVSDTALVTLVDTDSFQVRDNGRVYRCPVGKPEYTPPEMQGRSFSESDRQPEHDLFGLAVLIFQLLMEGTHPFAGLYQGAGDPPPYEERIVVGHFPYGTRRSPYRPMPNAPPLDILHPTLRQLFLRCFEDGHLLPSARPDAQTWQTALKEAEEALIPCAANPQHRYGRHLVACPWCERRRRLGGRDPFPVRPLAVERAAPRPPTLPNAMPSAPIAFSAPIAPPATSVVAASPSANSYAQVMSLPRNPWAWGAFGCAVVALASPTTVAPAVNLGFGLASVGCAVGTWRYAPRFSGRGKWMAGTSAFMGVLMALFVLPNLALQVRGPGAMQVLPMASGVRALAFSPDGTHLVSGSNRTEDQQLIGGEVALWDVHNGNMEDTLANYPGNVVALAYLPDGKSLVVGADAPLQNGEFDLLDARLRGAKQRLGIAHGVQAVACSKDGTLAAGGSEDGNVFLWDMRNAGLRFHWDRQGPVATVAFSPDGLLLAVGTSSESGSITPGKITLYNTRTALPLWRRNGHGNGVLAVAFSPDGRMLATAGNDDTVALHDARTGRILREMEGDQDAACLAFSPDGALLASGGGRQVAGATVYEITLWSVADGSRVRTLRGHRDRICALAFSPKGDILASAGMDATARLWRWRQDTAR